MVVTAFVEWPSAPLTDTLIRRALEKLPIPPLIISSLANYVEGPLIQWAAYDAIDHELTLSKPSLVCSSSYIIRKAIIRKHYLHRCIQAYVTKHPDCLLKLCVPRTWDIEISFADELDDMWSDELWDLSVELEKPQTMWWILKPGMADRGMGIRLFSSKSELQRILDSFEEQSNTDSDCGSEECGDTNIIISQLRHFVIQEYLTNTLLLDPRQVPIAGEESPPLHDLVGHKFHLRAYCIVSGTMTVYLYTRLLSLFSSEPYISPHSSTSQAIDLRPHLTNTCLQQHRGELGVRLFEELIGCNMLPVDVFGSRTLSREDFNEIIKQISGVLADTFQAAAQSPIHFQPLTNAFELYGVDFLVTHRQEDPSTVTINANRPGHFLVSLLEINAEPAIEMTGPRLTWILSDLFEAIGKACLPSIFQQQNEENQVKDTWEIGETRHCLRKCLHLSLR